MEMVEIRSIKEAYRDGGNAKPEKRMESLYETLQYIFAIGASDITDLIGNTLGGIIGISIFSMFSAFLGAKAVKIFNGLAAAGTVIVLLFLGMLLLANM